MPFYANVDDYIAAQSAAAQPRLHALRAIFRAAIPDATEVISYGIPTYKYRGGSVHFGAARRHCAIYGSAADRLGDELRGYVGEKGTVRFPHHQPLPEELVRKLVLATVAEHEAAHRGEP
jgi:uncharacterized protein YdhG (YjbR/CyaY superfamily)